MIVRLTPDSARLNALQDTAQFTAIAHDQYGNQVPSATFTWTSLEPEIVSIAGAGLAVAKANGTGRIVASIAGRSDTAKIVVQQVVAFVDVSPTSLTVFVHGTGRLTAAASDSNRLQVQGARISWSSSKPAAATVDSTGLVRGLLADTLTISASTEGVTGRATVSVRKAFYTVLVYMAADNSLSWEGVKDVDEAELVGSSDSVQVVIEAEFSPIETTRGGCGAQCFNRSNYNTFRYHVERGGNARGPDGPVLDIGNRDLTSPAELADFITWAVRNYPADKYLLILWNHGGGYYGLIEDQTSDPGSLMTLAELRQALQLAGTRFDVIDLDMSPKSWTPLHCGVDLLATWCGIHDAHRRSPWDEPHDGRTRRS